MVNPRERNQRMKSLFANVDPDALAKQPVPPSPTEADKRRVGSAAVKSMDRAFVSIEEENKRLHDQLTSAETVVEIDADKVIPSFVADRLDIEGDDGFAMFVESINESGQKLPILVRPLDGKPGHYQAAYGHRRLKACQILRRPVRAIIRPMSDEELIISQGIENSERLNLSFIEQGLFALSLKEKGYTRETISIALGRKPGQSITYISTMTNTVAQIPESLIRLIGAAQSVGRPKWEKLSSLLRSRTLSAQQQGTIDQLTSSMDWSAADAQKRLDLIVKALDQTAPSSSEKTEISLSDGLVISATTAGANTRISIPNNRVPGLSGWLLQRLPELVEEFKSQQKKDSDMS
jgi:ParB family transcriptional regulator, chromosome partitioning protein